MPEHAHRHDDTRTIARDHGFGARVGMRPGYWRHLARTARDLIRAMRGIATNRGADGVRDVVVADRFHDDPIASTYMHAAGAMVVQVPVERCRGLWFAGFACASDGDHPYVHTLRDHERGEADSYEASPLRVYFDQWQPASAAEALGLADDSFGGLDALRRAPAAAAMAPWWPTRDLSSFVQAFGASTRRENLRATASSPAATQPAAMGSHLFGPVNGQKGAIEFDRCVRVFRSVLRNGFRRDSMTLDGDVRGQALVRDDGSYAVFVLNGQHRVAAAAATGLSSIPVRFQHGAAVGPSIIRRSDVSHWPGVRSGMFTDIAALAVFDRLFVGRQPWVVGTEDVGAYTP